MQKQTSMSTVLWVPIVIFIAILGISFYRRQQMIRQAGQKEASKFLVNLTDETFEETINKGVTLVDFWAPWCTPCRIQDPVINEIADEIGDQASVCKLNVDDHKKAAVKMKIKNIPNIMIFKNGEPVMQLIGVKPKHAILKALKSVMDS